MITKKQIYCHSGGALGADTIFENQATLYKITTFAYSYQTPSHKSVNKIEISENDYLDGIDKIELASKGLKRKINYKYMHLLSRNWQQIKNSDQVFAVSEITFKKSSYVTGGTGWAVQMAIDAQKIVFVFDQKVNLWFKWFYESNEFIKLKTAPKITKQNFAGIGARKLNENGIAAIEQLFKDSYQLLN